ncbi:glycosyltransferase family 4 protein [Skermanella mucosa]|uniref:glycosyltransferase family 4 protein n=1 Tax=Skermanella mucosa TaxID=1789672 RepID=UPI00192C3F62|nr:glycosyltransferase family 4 protein [Skermanella mucosa]UEM22411.1 glycosyltransferase family 4 protein [Skermanella mucosa]
MTSSRPGSAPRVLFVCHNHPSFHPGGTEIFAHDLFRHMKDVDGIEAMFLACTNKVHRDQKPGTNFQTVGRSSDELVLWAGHFDRFYQSQIDLHGIVPDLSTLLQSFRPDIVHIHHTLLLGVEMLFLIRRVLPRARIVYTLHDYYPICANDGQMVTTDGHRLCPGASPDACHRCFPERTPDKFVLREKHLKGMLSLVDRFIAPSHFLRDRYVAWGLPADRIAVLRNGRPAAPAEERAPASGQSSARRNVFGYFGNLSPYKGIRVALDAARMLAEKDEDFVLHVHGGMPFQSDAFKAEIDEAAKSCGGRVIRHGAYRRDEMARLLNAVDWVITPSIWWENAPLVIQEAFQQGRPVICSDIGGMAEAVTDDHDGLHFRTGDAADLARAMRRAMTLPGLWQRLASNISPVRTVAESAAEHRSLYAGLTTAATLRSSRR